MAISDDLHSNYQEIILLPTLTIAGAVSATATTPVTGLGGMKYLAVEAYFLYGAGGTTVDAYVQTSLDRGVSWIDIMEFAFTTSALKKVNSVSIFQTSAAPYAPVTYTDGALTASTAVPGILGDRLRVKYVTVGTYTGATSLAIYALAKG